MAKTGRQSFQFMLRLPDDLRERLRVASEASGRSMTAEIIARLEETFDSSRIPEDLKRQVEVAAEENRRSMMAEIVERLRYTFDVRTIAKADILSEAIKALQQSAKDMAHQAEVLKWMEEQQSVSMRLLEMIARTDGHLKPEFMETLREILERRGQDTGFPEFPREN